MDIKAAQSDLREAYLTGALGALVSGIVWILAGITAHLSTFQNSMIVFFIGGMGIFPLSTFLSTQLNGKKKPADSNPLLPLGLQVTIPLFVGLFLAFWLCRDNPEHFYALMLMIIGGRYVSFTTLYGTKIYWALGLVLMTLGFVAFSYIDLSGGILAIMGGIIEIIFAGALLRVPRLPHAR